jgi:TfoX/Sxy family transcriptional regulator of competence genes
MATKKEYIDYVLEMIDGVGQLRYKKMFGEYMIYVNDKPALLVCDDTVFVKIIDNLKEDFENCEKGFPYQGAKEHYILDIDEKERSKELIKQVLPFLKVPKKR